MFIELLSFSGSLATKLMSLNNEKCKTRPFIIDLNPVELKYYPYIITLDKCNGSCNTRSEISGRICVLNKTENVNLMVFNLITKTNEQKKLSIFCQKKPISCKCKCKFDGKKCNSNKIWNNYKCRCKCKIPRKDVCKKVYIWNPATYSCENAGNIIADLAVTYPTCETFSTNFNEKR